MDHSVKGEHAKQKKKKLSGFFMAKKINKNIVSFIQARQKQVFIDNN